MRVTLIGGAGVFGERLAVLLARDGHVVTVAGRDLGRARAVAGRIGGTALQIDRAGGLAGLAGAQVVIDAAGPFRATGADPWRVARACIALGCHYLDLSDNAAFCAGITALDAQAQTAGVAVLSGVSSVPALSFAVARALAQGMDRVALVETAILPGNRAPRGRSVVDSIMAGVGTPFCATEAGLPSRLRGWSRPRRFDLGGGMVRQGWMVQVPDQSLFPVALCADTVTFRAGLELAVMNRSLALWSWLRAVTGLGPMRGRAVGVLLWLARMLQPFGTDRGGMVVEVTGRHGDGWLSRRWTLRAAAGEGPFIPGIAARCLLRDPALLTPGARPALLALPLTALTAAMADLAVETAQDAWPVVPLFARALGPARWAALPPAIRAGHDLAAPLALQGTAEVIRGPGLLPRLAAALLHFPAAARHLPVQVTMRPTAGGEVWTRQFGAATFRSHLRLGPHGLTERFGPLTFAIGLTASSAGLSYPVTRGWLCGVPLPRALLPVSDTTETAADGRFRFDVSLALPWRLGLMVRYRGWLVPVGGNGAAKGQ